MKNLLARFRSWFSLLPSPGKRGDKPRAGPAIDLGPMELLVEPSKGTWVGVAVAPGLVGSARALGPQPPEWLRTNRDEAEGMDPAVFLVNCPRSCEWDGVRIPPVSGTIPCKEGCPASWVTVYPEGLPRG